MRSGTRKECACNTNLCVEIGQIVELWLASAQNLGKQPVRRSVLDDAIDNVAHIKQLATCRTMKGRNKNRMENGSVRQRDTRV